MRRSLFFAAVTLVLAACVTVEPPPDPRGTINPGQRLVVIVNQAPGPWIVADPDSKAETALKLMPLGTFLQGMQEDRINAFSKEIQPYLPRPRYDQAVETALIRALKSLHDGPVQTAAEAGIAPAQRRDWNASADQLDWRRKYYYTELGRQSPRDYAKILSLDDAVIIDVNVSFGLEPEVEERTLPVLSAAARAHRAGTNRLLWSREERLSDTTSSSTLTEFRAAPVELTDRLYAMAAPLGERIAGALARESGLRPKPAPILVDPSAIPVAPATGAAPDISTAPLVAPPAGDGAPAPVTPAPEPTDGLAPR